jgi:uncharacterized protein (TIGR00369 family)
MTDADIRALLSDPMKLSPCTRLLGFELMDLSIEDGTADMAFTSTPDMTNPLGTLQGGLVAAMLDDAMGVAARAHRRFEIVVPTLSLNVVFIKPTPIGRVLARGVVTRMGRTTAQLEGKLLSLSGDLLATSTAMAAVRPHDPATMRAKG